MKKMKNAKKKILMSSFAVLSMAALTGTTTFAWFTQSSQPKVDEFGMQVTTMADDLNISFKYGAEWTKPGPLVESKYFGVDGKGNQMIDGLVGFFEDTDNGVTDTGNPDYKLNKLSGYSLTHATTNRAELVAGAKQVGFSNLPDAKLHYKGAKTPDGDQTPITGMSKLTVPKNTAAGGYMQFTFRFTSNSQYMVFLNRKEDDGQKGQFNIDGVKCEPIGERPVQKDTDIPRFNPLAWNANTALEVPATTDLGYPELTAGEPLVTRGAYAARFGFGGQSFFRLGAAANINGVEISKLQRDGEEDVYQYDGNRGSLVKIEGSKEEVAQKVTELSAGGAAGAWVLRPVGNIYDPHKNFTRGKEKIGFPENTAEKNMAYNFELYQKKLSGEIAANRKFAEGIEVPNPDGHSANIKYKSLYEDDKFGYVAPVDNILQTGDETQTREPLLILQKDPTSESYTGYLNLYIWLEGWDGDCFSAILEDKFVTSLQFGGILVNHDDLDYKKANAPSA